MMPPPALLSPEGILIDTAGTECCCGDDPGVGCPQDCPPKTPSAVGAILETGGDTYNVSITNSYPWEQVPGFAHYWIPQPPICTTIGHLTFVNTTTGQDNSGPICGGGGGCPPECVTAYSGTSSIGCTSSNGAWSLRMSLNIASITAEFTQGPGVLGCPGSVQLTPIGNGWSWSLGGPTVVDPGVAFI